MKKLFLLCMIVALPVSATETPPRKNEISTYVELRGPSKKIDHVLEQIRGGDAFKAADCKKIVADKYGKVVGMSCVLPDFSLLETLNENTPPSVRWMMSAQGCPVGCVNTRCPPLNGMVGCCKKVEGVYKRC